MNACLGLDTSNYTTSAALYIPEDQQLFQQKKLLPVENGQRGLRQSDALFHHVRQLPDVLNTLRNDCDAEITAIGASNRPQQQDGSYMPCFLAGAGAAAEIGACLRVPVYYFTHQQGHVAAALYGVGKLAWLTEPFLAFHVSGGTTDVLHVQPDKDDILACRVIAKSLDLKAGQLIDRVGVMLGLPFPAGPAMETLAQRSDRTYLPRASMDGDCCHLSGVQNQCEAIWKDGAPAEDVALFCLKSVEAAIVAMTAAVQNTYADLPLLYAGGVMSNAMLKASLSERFGGVFAPPVYSADNAAGIAVLTAIRKGRE
ncbi:MAG: peptidase M22 [Clostridia bacterium]|nr:peptidase M22 [Clostridia bacterium]